MLELIKSSLGQFGRIDLIEMNHTFDAYRDRIYSDEIN